MKKRNTLIWIGIRESEIADVKDFFNASITIFGSNCGMNYSFEKKHNLRIDYSIENKALCCFIEETAEKLIVQYPDCQFMLYYPMEAMDFGRCIQERAICVNASTLTDFLENKLYTKLWLSSSVPVIPFSTFIGRELDYDELCIAFASYKHFVLQGTFSCGGSNTWLISSQQDIIEIQSKIISDDIYTVTPYLKNSISVNIHLIIYEEKVVLFPMSTQIIKIMGHSLHYGGADYIMPADLPTEIKNKVQNFATIVGKKLQMAGYRGICGIDMLTTKEEVYFLEINARFQSSSFLLNRALKCNNYPTLQELNMEAFFSPIPSVEIENLSVNESFYDYSYHPSTFNRMKYLWEIVTDCPDVQLCIDDMIDWHTAMERDTYLYKLIFNRNITCVTSEYTCRIYNGLDVDWGLIPDIPWDKQPKRFKISLLNQGIKLSNTALQNLSEKGGPNYEEFYALDISVENKVYINVPYKVPFSEISPFEVDYAANDFVLKYYGDVIANVQVRTVDSLATEKTQNGIPYSVIAYNGVDRLRIHGKNGCYFKEHEMGCHFCGLEAYCKNYTLVDIKEIISAYSKKTEIRHYLVGGGSYNPNSSFKETLEIAQYIFEKTGKKIYLMAIPPTSTEILQELKKAGVSEVAFNLEIYDRNIARQYMPGKGNIPLKQYEKAFEEAVKLWGKTGNVRSALIVGLEPEDSLLAGIEYLCKLGVSPILSIIKPDGMMENFLSPSSQEILEIWEKTENICLQNNILLGPTCHYCEDNVLKITI